MTSQRVKNILFDNKIGSLEQLAAMSWKQCFHWPDCGWKALEELRELLAKAGLKFVDDEDLELLLANKGRVVRSQTELDKQIEKLKSESSPDRMRLRDQFAMAALARMKIEKKEEARDAVWLAYYVADHMLIERNRY